MFLLRRVDLSSYNILLQACERLLNCRSSGPRLAAEARVIVHVKRNPDKPSLETHAVCCAQ